MKSAASPSLLVPTPTVRCGVAISGRIGGTRLVVLTHHLNPATTARLMAAEALHSRRAAITPAIRPACSRSILNEVRTPRFIAVHSPDINTRSAAMPARIS